MLVHPSITRTFTQLHSLIDKLSDEWTTPGSSRRVSQSSPVASRGASFPQRPPARTGRPAVCVRGPGDSLPSNRSLTRGAHAVRPGAGPAGGSVAGALELEACEAREACSQPQEEEEEEDGREEEQQQHEQEQEHGRANGSGQVTRRWGSWR